MFTCQAFQLHIWRIIGYVPAQGAVDVLHPLDWAGLCLLKLPGAGEEPEGEHDDGGAVDQEPCLAWDGEKGH